MESPSRRKVWRLMALGLLVAAGLLFYDLVYPVVGPGGFVFGPNGEPVPSWVVEKAEAVAASVALWDFMAPWNGRDYPVYHTDAWNIHRWIREMPVYIVDAPPRPAVGPYDWLPHPAPDDYPHKIPRVLLEYFYSDWQKVEPFAYKVKHGRGYYGVDPSDYFSTMWKLGAYGMLKASLYREYALWKPYMSPVVKMGTVKLWPGIAASIVIYPPEAPRWLIQAAKDLNVDYRLLFTSKYYTKLRDWLIQHPDVLEKAKPIKYTMIVSTYVDNITEFIPLLARAAMFMDYPDVDDDDVAFPVKIGYYTEPRLSYIEISPDYHRSIDKYMASDILGLMYPVSPPAKVGSLSTMVTTALVNLFSLPRVASLHPGNASDLLLFAKENRAPNPYPWTYIFKPKDEVEPPLIERIDHAPVILRLPNGTTVKVEKLWYTMEEAKKILEERYNETWPWYLTLRLAYGYEVKDPGVAGFLAGWEVYTSTGNPHKIPFINPAIPWATGLYLGPTIDTKYRILARPLDAPGQAPGQLAEGRLTIHVRSYITLPILQTKAFFAAAESLVVPAMIYPLIAFMAVWVQGTPTLDYYTFLAIHAVPDEGFIQDGRIGITGWLFAGGGVMKFAGIFPYNENASPFAYYTILSLLGLPTAIVNHDEMNPASGVWVPTSLFYDVSDEAREILAKYGVTPEEMRRQVKNFFNLKLYGPDSTYSFYYAFGYGTGEVSPVWAMSPVAVKGILRDVDKVIRAYIEALNVYIERHPNETEEAVKRFIKKNDVDGDGIPEDVKHVTGFPGFVGITNYYRIYGAVVGASFTLPFRAPILDTYIEAYNYNQYYKAGRSAFAQMRSVKPFYLSIFPHVPIAFLAGFDEVVWKYPPGFTITRGAMPALWEYTAKIPELYPDSPVELMSKRRNYFTKPFRGKYGYLNLFVTPGIVSPCMNYTEAAVQLFKIALVGLSNAPYYPGVGVPLPPRAIMGLLPPPAQKAWVAMLGYGLPWQDIMANVSTTGKCVGGRHPETGTCICHTSKPFSSIMTSSWLWHTVAGLTDGAQPSMYCYPVMGGQDPPWPRRLTKGVPKTFAYEYIDRMEYLAASTFMGLIGSEIPDAPIPLERENPATWGMYSLSLHVHDPGLALREYRRTAREWAEVQGRMCPWSLPAVSGDEPLILVPVQVWHAAFTLMLYYTSVVYTSDKPPFRYPLMPTLTAVLPVLDEAEPPTPLAGLYPELSRWRVFSRGGNVLREMPLEEMRGELCWSLDPGLHPIPATTHYPAVLLLLEDIIRPADARGATPDDEWALEKIRESARYFDGYTLQELTEKYVITFPDYADKPLLRPHLHPLTITLTPSLAFYLLTRAAIPMYNGDMARYQEELTQALARGEKPPTTAEYRDTHYPTVYDFTQHPDAYPLLPAAVAVNLYTEITMYESNGHKSNGYEPPATVIGLALHDWRTGNTTILGLANATLPPIPQVTQAYKDPLEWLNPTLTHKALEPTRQEHG